MLRQIASVVARQGWVRKIALSTPGIRGLAWRFVAGEDLDTGLAAVRRLNAQGIAGTLNYVGTHVRAAPDARAAADAAIDALRRVHEEGLSSHVSVKLTQLGLDVDPGLCEEQLRRVLDCAKELGTFVRIDMEESGYVDRTVNLFEAMRQAYGSQAVGLAFQSYLRRRRPLLERLIAGDTRIRLVKGGYWESPDIVFRRKAEVDAAFLEDIELVLTRARDPAIATHDITAIDHARGLAQRLGLEKQDFEFQMLYGVRPDLQGMLAGDGYRVRCYVPYGHGWYEYVLGCLRRVAGGGMRRRILRPGVPGRGSRELPSEREHRRASAVAPPSPRVGAGEAKRSFRLSLAFKRCVDVAGAITALVILSPVIACVAIAIAAIDGLPVIFSQARPGRDGAPFTVIKFRTMRPPHPGEVWYMTDEKRVTRLGRVLRATSLDELPELWNVVRGDMSLVGPRPLLLEYVNTYTPAEWRRHEMRPGITGWAAVNGRNVLRFRDRLALDVWYVDHWSLWLDLRILLMTICQVVRRTNVATTEDLALGFPLPGIESPDRACVSAATQGPPLTPCPMIAGSRTRPSSRSHPHATGAESVRPD